MDLHRFQVFVVVVVLCSLGTCRSAVAQSGYETVCRSELEAAPPQSVQALLASLKLTDSLKVQNLESALDNATKTLALAQSLTDPDAIVVAQADCEMLRFHLSGPPEDQSQRSLEFRLSHRASPALRLHFDEVLIEQAIWSEAFSTPLKLIVQDSSSAAQACGDRHLFYKQQFQELYFRLFWLGQTAPDPQVVALQNSIREGYQLFPFLEHEVYLHLQEFLSSKTLGDYAAAERSLTLAIAAAQTNRNRFLECRCWELMSIVQLQQGQTKQSELSLTQFERVATELKSQALLQKNHLHLSEIEDRLNNQPQRKQFLKLAEQADTFEQSPVPVKDFVYQNLLDVSQKLKQVVETKHYQIKVLPPAAIELARIDLQTLHQTQNKLLQSQLEIVAERKSSEQMQQLASERIQFLKTYALFTTLLIGLLVPWGLLLMARSKLKRVEKKLDTQRSVTRDVSLRYDDLTLRLQRIQRMESLGLMAGSVAHDFNNILVGVIGNAELIELNGVEGNEPFIRQRLTDIIQSAEKAAGLSRQMLSYAGKHDIFKQRIELNHLVRQYESVLQSTCREDQLLHLDLSETGLYSSVDPIQIEQILLNLVTNAVHAAPGNSLITVRTGMVKLADDDLADLIGTRQTGGDFCWLEVVDRGSGLAENERERIFEPFYTGSDEGRGLGLSVVYGAVERHDGFIQCQSQPNIETRFRVLLPVAESNLKSEPVTAEASNHSLASSDLTAWPTECKTILLIDDELGVLDFCEQIFQHFQWTVITANNAKNGLEKLLEHHNEISCILMDVVMPEMGASEFLRELENREIATPIVLMSGFSKLRMEFFFDRLNVFGMVDKPFRASEILAAAEAAAQRQRFVRAPVITARH